MKTIFKSENGEVWRDDNDNYGTLKAGHELCRDMAKEIERLQGIIKSPCDDCESKQRIIDSLESQLRRAGEEPFLENPM